MNFVQSIANNQNKTLSLRPDFLVFYLTECDKDCRVDVSPFGYLLLNY